MLLLLTIKMVKEKCFDKYKKRKTLLIALLFCSRIFLFVIVFKAQSPA